MRIIIFKVFLLEEQLKSKFIIINKDIRASKNYNVAIGNSRVEVKEKAGKRLFLEDNFLNEIDNKTNVKDN